MIEKIHSKIPLILIIAILAVFIFVFRIFGGIEIRPLYITLRGVLPLGFSDVNDYILKEFMLYVLGFFVIVFGLFTLYKIKDFEKLYRKVEVLLFIILTILTLVFSIIYINAFGGICTMSIPAFCYVWIESTNSIVWLLKGSIILFVIYNIVLFVDLIVIVEKSVKSKIIYTHIIPYGVMMLLSLFLLHTIFYLALSVILFLYVIIVSLLKVDNGKNKVFQKN